MDKPPPSTNKKPTAPAYISSSGHVLETYVTSLSPHHPHPFSYIMSQGPSTNVLFRPPLIARLSRFSSDMYDFLGLYFVSLFSLDPYTAAQNSNFNTRGRPNAYQERSRWGSSNRLGGGGGGGGGAGGGGGNGGGGPAPRRMGGIDDVRGPECGSCG